jgi:hypothetical protein
MKQSMFNKCWNLRMQVAKSQSKQNIIEGTGFSENRGNS